MNLPAQAEWNEAVSLRGPGPPESIFGNENPLARFRILGQKAAQKYNLTTLNGRVADLRFSYTPMLELEYGAKGHGDK